MTIQGQYADVLDVARDILAETLVHSGGTFNAKTGEAVQFDGEYIVGGAQDETVLPLDLNQTDRIVEAIAAHIQRIPSNIHGEKRYFLGTWVEDGQLYIDSSEAFKNRTTALLKARERGEIAIYDTLAGESVYV